MKLSEFLSEDFKFPTKAVGKDDLYYTLPGSVELPDITSQDPYLIYRVGMAMAAKDHAAQGGRFNEYSVITYYTKQEEELIEKLLSKSGVRSKKISTDKSEEPKETNTTSPIMDRGPITRK